MDIHPWLFLRKAIVENDFKLVKKIFEERLPSYKKVGLLIDLASRFGHFDMVRYFIKQGVKIDTSVDKVLIEAIVHNQFKIVKHIIENVSIDLNNPIFITKAIDSGNLNIVEYLNMKIEELHQVNLFKHTTISNT